MLLSLDEIQLPKPLDLFNFIVENIREPNERKEAFFHAADQYRLFSRMAMADRDIDTADKLFDGAGVMLGAGYAFSQVELEEELEEVLDGVRKDAYDLLTKDLKKRRDKNKFWPTVRRFWPVFVEKMKFGFFHWCNIWSSFGA